MKRLLLSAALVLLLAVAWAPKTGDRHVIYKPVFYEKPPSLLTSCTPGNCGYLIRGVE